MKTIRALLFVCFMGSSLANAASGAMGTGVPHFGVYSNAAGIGIQHASVWALSDATFPFPAECPFLILAPDTMGMESYKLAVALMLTAKLTNRRLTFFAHAPRDGGCGVDYVELF